MTDNDDHDYDYAPITSAFELQRTAIEQSREAVERMIDFQHQWNEAVVSGTEMTGEFYGQGIETSRRAMHGYLDVVETTFPGSDDAVTQIRETIDEQFDQLEAQQREAMDLAEDSIGDAEDAPEAYLDALDDQLDVLIDAHEQTEERTVEALEQIETQLEQLQEDGRAQAEELQERVQDLQRQLQPSVSEE